MDGLKQRVIGALVLVSLAVIFVPMLFDEPHSERSSRVIDLPEEPPFPEVNISEPVDVAQPAVPSYRMEEHTPEMPSSEPQMASPVNQTEPAQVAPELAPQPIAQPEPVSPEPAPVAQPQEEPVTPTDYTNSMDGAWIVQLGSFGNADNARRLRDRAREQGYSCHLQEVSRGDSVLTRVFCGPYAERSLAEGAKPALDSEFGLNSLVTSGDK
ncbi:SPOR domain-containing protein [Marinobacter mobilis]|uniref:DedD protein n=1 Tax=Marinobacter mobilis TaxID=488533 RepID=A0A1H2V3R5_9GAMM|nr:SPOR domain-containing protein [Marinobacter mobilis]SDW62935.1 DedD protein [Marinobacter mobilis]